MKAGRYEVRIKRSAEKEMDRLPNALHDRVSKLILSLEANPRPRGCTKLRGQESYRVRCGDYRILYTVDDRVRLVYVFAVGHRRDVYHDV